MQLEQPSPGTLGYPMHRLALTLALLATPALAQIARAQNPGAEFGAMLANPAVTYGEQLEGFPYPFPVSHHRFTSQGQDLDMAFMDVAPTAAPNGRTAVLLHGKNFCAATWEATIRTLAAAGYRVIAPDQVGFCASTKPAGYQYSFQQLAQNTHGLLAALGIGTATVIGHSTGGMLAIRWALTLPADIDRLVLVDPIGLEDWKALGVPSIGVDGWYARELRVTADSIRTYERATYYAGTWDPAYDRWVQMLAGLNRGPSHERVAWNSALLYDMIYTQPVFYEFERLTTPTLLMVGDKDTTAIGKDLAPPDRQAALGHYPALARAAAARIPRCTLVEWPDYGHAPQIQAPDAFHKALLEYLSAP